jgi:RNA polymerase subunit RPABC4/transcription elongation factor Spt4
MDYTGYNVCPVCGGLVHDVGELCPECTMCEAESIHDNLENR